MEWVETPPPPYTQTKNLKSPSYVAHSWNEWKHLTMLPLHSCIYKPATLKALPIFVAHGMGGNP